MPELPDVEGFRRVAAEHAAGERVRQVDVADGGVLTNSSADEFAGALRGRRFGEPRRHGKWLVLPTDGEPAVLLHFGMTGSLLWCAAGQPVHRHDRVVFGLEDGELRYRDMRKLTGLSLVRGSGGVQEALRELGPDAASIRAEELTRLLRHHRRGVKAALMDQAVLAGLGNLLVDEILWQARIPPGARTDEIDDERLRALHRAMRRALRTSIRAERVPPRRDWLTGVRDDPHAACPRCGTPLESGRVAGRSTRWCQHCQR